VVDRLIIRDGVRGRLMEAVEGALKWNANEVQFLIDDTLHHFDHRRMRIRAQASSWRS